MSTLLFHDFLTSYLAHIDGTEVLGHEIHSYPVLTAIDPPAGAVIVHAANLQKRDANGMRNQRVRVYVYGHGVSTTADIAEVLHAAIVDSGVLIPGKKDRNWNTEQTFFDHIDSEQAPTQMQSHGLTSVCFNFDLVAVSRAIN